MTLQCRLVGHAHCSDNDSAFVGNTQTAAPEPKYAKNIEVVIHSLFAVKRARSDIDPDYNFASFIVRTNKCRI